MSNFEKSLFVILLRSSFPAAPASLPADAGLVLPVVVVGVFSEMCGLPPAELSGEELAFVDGVAMPGGAERGDGHAGAPAAAAATSPGEQLAEARGMAPEAEPPEAARRRWAERMSKNSTTRFSWVAETWATSPNWPKPPTTPTAAAGDARLSCTQRKSCSAPGKPMAAPPDSTAANCAHRTSKKVTKKHLRTADMLTSNLAISP
mmetsp:Transcript_117741/g.329709  ORF Transcript_117741/g.329709 Transcript_117741/m.329709 type:complete len:205 (-) Transcript_117741:209-823(-)